jgi:hypothetical protein
VPDLRKTRLAWLTSFRFSACDRSLDAKAALKEDVHPSNKCGLTEPSRRTADCCRRPGERLFWTAGFVTDPSVRPARYTRI